MGGVAHAQTSAPAPSVAQPNATPGAAAPGAPWYERFTRDPIAENETQIRPDPDRQTAFSLNTARWGLTVNVQDADRSRALSQDRAALGAYYHFTPRFRVGGELSVAGEMAAEKPLVEPRRRDQERQPAAGVRLESAFKF
jgi:hypothetical protein